MTNLPCTMFGYWRSSCTWRVRIALALKGIDTGFVEINLKNGEQMSQNFHSTNQVPFIRFSDGRIMGQSSAIITLIEEIFPYPSLIPSDPIEKAFSLQFAEIINANIQPLQKFSVPNRLERQRISREKWARTFSEKGLHAMERQLRNNHFQFICPAIGLIGR